MNRAGSEHPGLILPAGISTLWNEPERQSNLPVLRSSGEDVAEVVGVEPRLEHGHGSTAALTWVRLPTPPPPAAASARGAGRQRARHLRCC